MSLEATLAYIHRVQWRGQKPGLSRIDTLLGCLGHPERTLKFVHVGGTNGKGSTCAMMESVLRRAGLHTGLYTSPYINRFHERIRVDGEEISDRALEEIIDLLRPHADAMEDLPSEFELITAAALLYFARCRCDIVVLEVGLGGEFDATNVISCPEVAVFTAMGMDHTAVLGSTLEAIARTKAGIIKPGCEVVTYPQPPQAQRVLEEICRAQGAALRTADFSALHSGAMTPEGRQFDFAGRRGLQIPLLGGYQPGNAAVAITALEVLMRRGWPITEVHLREGLAAVQWPGRFEILRREPLFLLDGSHNVPGMAATAESLRELFPNRKPVVLLSVMADKDVAGMLELLLPLAERFFTVTADNPRALSAQALAQQLTDLGAQAQSCDSIPEGVAAALAAAGEQGSVCALGTLYFSGDVRSALARLTH